MVLKLRKRESMPIRILIYGLDGSGKSTFAEQFCKENNLHPICVDIDDTNFTDVDCIVFERTNHIKVKEQLIQFIKDATAAPEYDTIIIDGISSLLNLLVSNSKGIAKYGDRTSALNKILNELVKSKQNVIFVGQIDLKALDEQSSAAVVNINSIVNEKYECFNDNGKFTTEVKKFRRLDTSTPIPKKALPKTEEITGLQEEPVDSIFKDFNDIALSIHAENNDLTSAKQNLFKLLQDGIVTEMNCPKILTILEELYK